MSYVTKRKLAIRSKKSPMATDDAVAVWVDAYQPEIVSASVWDGALHDFVAGLVRELDVGLEASKRYGVFAVLVTPCDHRGLMGLVGEASPVKWGRLHSFVNL